MKRKNSKDYLFKISYYRFIPEYKVESKPFLQEVISVDKHVLKTTISINVEGDFYVKALETPSDMISYYLRQLMFHGRRGLIPGMETPYNYRDQNKIKSYPEHKYALMNGFFFYGADPVADIRAAKEMIKLETGYHPPSPIPESYWRRVSELIKTYLNERK